MSKHENRKHWLWYGWWRLLSALQVSLKLCHWCRRLWLSLFQA
jgi:hypothetical protein